MSKKRTIMDAITRNDNGTVVYLDFVPCPNDTPNHDCVSRALEYYQELYPGDFIDVLCYNKA